MITISDKPYKKTEFYKGTITVAVPNSEQTEWNFTLARTTNGKVEDEVEVDKEQLDKEFPAEDYNQDDEGRKLRREQVFAATDAIERSVLANVRKNTFSWNPQNK